MIEVTGVCRPCKLFSTANIRIFPKKKNKFAIMYSQYTYKYLYIPMYNENI